MVLGIVEGTERYWMVLEDTGRYCRERLFVALDFRKGDFGAPLTRLAMRRIIFLVLGLIKKVPP